MVSSPSFLPPLQLHMPHWPLYPVGQLPAGTPSERTRALLKKLGSPELRLPPVVHVGGTKGKGSTIAFLRTMLEAAGYKVHAYTSPHIARFNERVVLAGREIDDDTLYEVIEAARIACGDTSVGFFDATTAAVMLAFASHNADIMLMEMGLGGAVDATNIIENPLLTVLTTVSYDHMEHMGTTLPEITRFEAGLLKPGVPCVASYQHPDSWPALEQEASAINAPLYMYGRHWNTRRSPAGMIYADAHGEAQLPLPSLLGAHQLVNAGNAIAALSALEDFDVQQDHIVRGLMQTEWKGRLQKLPCPMLPAECELWFDGGHNVASAQAITLFAAEYWHDKPVYLIFGFSEGKDIKSILEPFTRTVKKFYSVSVKSEPKSYAAETAANMAKPVAEATACDSIHDAVRAIIKDAGQPFRALVFGSLYLWLEANTTQ